MSKVKVICVNGFSRAGKSTFVELMKKKAPVVIEHSTIDTVKKALTINGLLYPDRKGPKERAFLTAVKKSWREYNDGPFQEIIKRVAYLEDHYRFMENIKEVLLFVQVREPQEIYKIHTYFIPDVYSVLVERPGIPPQPGDGEVYDFDYDYNVYNDGTLDDLNISADRFLRFLREEN